VAVDLQMDMVLYYMVVFLEGETWGIEMLNEEQYGFAPLFVYIQPI
jgi:hypothetical protein